MSIQQNIKRFIRWVVNILGFEIYRIRSYVQDNKKQYEKVLPFASYSPWNIDDSFLAIYKIIKNFTLVDRYRCFELWTLMQQSAKLENGSIIEIGVWRGGTGALIAKQAENCGILNSIYLCDTFTGIVKAGPKDSHYKGGEHSNTSRQVVEELVYKKLQLNNVQILQGIFPEETASQLESEKFRLCHIDVDVYQSAKDIINWVWDRMVHNGIIVYDDYGFPGCDGITKFVEEQIPYKDRLILHNLNGHAIVIKL